MSWTALVLAYALSFTVVPDSGLMLYDERPRGYDESAVYIDMDAELRWGLLFAGGGMIVETYPKSIAAWEPTGLRYVIGGGLRYRGIELGIRHWCQHPLITYEPVWAERDVVISPRSEGWQTQVYLSFSGETPLLR